MKSFTLAAIFLLNTVLFVQAQTCTSASQNLVIRGFRLQMTESEAKRRYPKIRIFQNQDGNGLSTAGIGFPYQDFDEVFTEVERKSLSSVELTFLDKQLALIKIAYDGFTEWNSINEFIDTTSKQLKLPLSGNWQVIKKNTLRLDCRDFFIISNLDPKLGRYDLQKPSLLISKNNFDAQLAEREKTKKDRQRQIFKP